MAARGASPGSRAPQGAVAPLLGVTRSLTGRRWRLRCANQGSASEGSADEGAQAQEIATAAGLSLTAASILARRGIGAEDCLPFLTPTLRALLPDPSVFKDMDRAAERLARAVRDGETVAVFGDYDVDGATAAAVLHEAITAAGGRARIYIPDRQREGYGPNLPALLALRDEGARLVVTVDCGTTAHGVLAEAAAAGIEVVVVDHHAAEPQLPAAFAVINPNRLDEEAGHGTLAAVGVAFLLAVAVQRCLRQAGWFTGGRDEPDLKRSLDLVALGTVADVVPLTGLNRALVRQGLAVLGFRQRPGLAALLAAAAVPAEEPIEAFHLGFQLAPRINAGGRVGEAGLGARLLTTSDPAEAAALAARLDALNRERQAIEEEVLADATAQVEAAAQGGGLPALIFAAAPGWHAGVIGIVAGRLKERFDRPALVIALDGDGPEALGRGSARSVPGVDIGALVMAARSAGLLVNGGGHPMAAGLTVAASVLHNLAAFLAEQVEAALTASGHAPAFTLDALLSPGAATPALVAELARLGPFGAGNPQPRLALPRMRVARARAVGGDGAHLSLTLAAPDGGSLKAIAFRAFDGGMLGADGEAAASLGSALSRAGGRPVHVAGTLRRDRWQGGDGVQLHVEDAAFAEG